MGMSCMDTPSKSAIAANQMVDVIILSYYHATYLLISIRQGDLSE